MSEIDLIKSKLEQLSQQQGSQSYEDHGELFHSLNDVTRFLEDTKVHIGWCWDLFSCLSALDAKAKTGIEIAQERKTAHQTNTTIKENELHAAMRCPRPTILFGHDVDGRPQSLDKGMARCSTHA